MLLLQNTVALSWVPQIFLVSRTSNHAINPCTKQYEESRSRMCIDNAIDQDGNCSTASWHMALEYRLVEWFCCIWELVQLHQHVITQENVGATTFENVPWPVVFFSEWPLGKKTSPLALPRTPFLSSAFWTVAPCCPVIA